MPRKSTPAKPEKKSLTQVKEQIESVVGSPVSIERADWATLMRQGVVVRLHLRRWRAKTQITLADLGLPQPKNGDEEHIYNDLMSLGAKRLLPPDIIRELDSIDSGSRKCLGQNSYHTYWGDFVPLGKWEEWKVLNGEFVTRYLDVRDDIHKRWNAIMRDLIDAYAIAARVAYKRLIKLNSRALVIDGKRLNEDQFVDAFMERIKSAIPTRDEVYASFAYETELSFIPLPSLLASDAAEKERIENAREVERVKERTVLMQHEQEQDLLRQSKWDREAALRRMTDEVLAEARTKQNELVNGFLTDISAQSMSAIYDGLQNVLQSMQKNNGVLVGRAAEQVRGVIDSWRAMNLMGDQAIEQQIARAETFLDTEPKKRNPAEIEGLLVAIGNQARSNLIALGAMPRQVREFALPDRSGAEPIAPRRTSRALPATQLTLDQKMNTRQSRTLKSPGEKS
jgi:hypothetical protein